ncbi:LAMI_0B02784g1_1 [Lachancea mirantina]|uniref:LAMI_0B02784g1_1 n=1 Tax=Lachancea mirantina TaxID=1230905 RepID=A0A1G4IUB9_9SACH|nr:LAMI_0B02784g1_1 [Lachancea mirantina]
MTETQKRQPQGLSHDTRNSKSSAGMLFFEGKPTQLSPKDTVKCFKYIEKEVLRSLVSEKLLAESYVKYVSKNTQIKDFVAELQQRCTDSHQSILLYSYGAHVQKAVTVVEIFKKEMRRGDADDAPAQKGGIKQYNALSCFVNVVQGRNELLERKLNIPVLIVALVPSEREFSFPKFTPQ